MDIAVISLTENGREFSRRIAETPSGHRFRRYCFHKHTDGNAEAFTDINALTGCIFSTYDALIFVCACGIAVRAAAPYLRSKTTDPAVLAVDDCGKFIIPVLSGHIGGANALARQLAVLTGAVPVVTTATDTGGRFSPDCFAAANGLVITDLRAAKEIAAAVLDGEKTGLVTEYKCLNMPEDVVCGSGSRTGIYIGSGDVEPFPVTLRLVPRNIVIGIGCKKGITAGTVSRRVHSALNEAGIPFERVYGAASIDLKSDEKGLLEFCSSCGLELSFFSAEELMSTEGEFTPSAFVMETAGADNVCERSAVRLSDGRLVLRKSAAEGVTVAAAEKPIIIDFERKML
ncbi:MAG: cobalt-precorrin 5A hydrolase [Ruminococcus sp.]|nr:cobalt-precorrin 5A hydrolase [Ruminococcus sp.]